MRPICVLLLAILPGCAWDRSDLEDERVSQLQQRDEVRGILDRNAPVGSRWATHADSQYLMNEMQRRDDRVREIDCELAK